MKVHRELTEARLPGQPSRESARLILIAVWFGLASGLLEAAVFSIVRSVPSWITWKMRLANVSAEIFWVAPLFDVVLFLVVGCLLAGAAGLVRQASLLQRADFEAVAILLFALAAFYAAARVPDRLGGPASFLLALGLSVQVCRVFQARRDEAMRFFRRTVGVLILAVSAAAIATTGLTAATEAVRVRHLPPPPPGAPNVLLLVLDTARADHLSTYGYDRSTTPQLDALAREGAVFENAFAPSSWTPPSHASLLTGRFLHEHGVDGDRPALDDRFATLGEALSAHGYATAAFVANTLWITRNSGFDRGFLHFEDYFRSLPDMMARTVYGKEIVRRLLRPLGYRYVLGQKRAEDVNAALLRWIDANRGRPFFAFLNYMEPHSPYVSPALYHTRFMDGRQREMERAFAFNPPAVYDGSADSLALLLAGYDGALAFLDAQLGAFIAELRRRDLLDRTLVIVTSDHGEAFAEHGLLEHGHSLNRELLHVPLILRLPGSVPARRRIPAPVSIRDVPATVTSLLFPGAGPLFPGPSLAAHWSPAGPGRLEAQIVLSEVAARRWLPKALPISHGWLKSLITPRWHFILHETGRVELYDRQEDRNEARNLGQTPVGAVVVAKLKRELEGMIAGRERQVTAGLSSLGSGAKPLADGDLR